MGRLTQKEASGRWQVKGIPWEGLREGGTLTKETSQILYGCLCKLKDYEDTGMDPYRIEGLRFELEDMAERVCDNVCRFRQEMTEQEELNGACSSCPVSVCMGLISGMGG